MQTGLASYDQMNVGIDSHSDFENKRKGRARISGDQILQMMKDVESRFIKPKPQSELGGKLGVTLTDIAESLGVAHKDLRRKVERSGAVEKITCLNHLIRTYILIPAVGARTESYVMDIEAAQHIVSKYDNAAGWAYTDYLIRCKDALKVSLEDHKKLVADLAKANKKIEKLTQPKISKTPKISTMKVIPAHNDHYHEGEFKLIPEVIQYPKKGETRYDEAYVQKVTKITNGNIRGIKKALKNMGCSSEAINNCLSVFEAMGKDFDGLINPTDAKEYAELKKRVEREFGSLMS